MKVLIVCSGNKNRIAPFISDQVAAIKKRGVDIQYFLIHGKGLYGYFKNLKALNQAINSYNPDVIHAHYGLSGLLAAFQTKVPVITTYHGTDINNPKLRRLSKIAVIKSKHNIFVSEELSSYILSKKKSVVPCGVDTEIFAPMDKLNSRKTLKLSQEKKYILFSSSFDNRIKNYSLAKKAVEHIEQEEIELLELKGYSREEVALLMNAVDMALLTSFSEGSPQFVKEALACNCPVISTHVGDVKELLKGVENCYITDYDAFEISQCINAVLNSKKRCDGQKVIQFNNLDNNNTVTTILNIYQKVTNQF